MAAAVLFLYLIAGSPDRFTDLREDLRRQFPDVKVITTEALAQTVVPDSLLILDVRSPAEYAVSRIPGAQRVDDAASWIVGEGALAHRDRPIVVYCSVGVRSASFARALQDAGFRDVRNLDGSLFAWASENRPVVNDAGPASGVHPYDYWWGQYLPRHFWRWTTED